MKGIIRISIPQENIELDRQIAAKEESIAQLSATVRKGIRHIKRDTRILNTLNPIIQKIHNNSLEQKQKKLNHVTKVEKVLVKKSQDIVKRTKVLREDKTRGAEYIRTHSSGLTITPKPILAKKKSRGLPKPKVATEGLNRAFERTSINAQFCKMMEEEPGVAPINGKFLYTIDTINDLTESVVQDYESGVKVTHEYMLAKFSLLDCECNRRALNNSNKTTQRSRRSSNPFSKPKQFTTDEAETVVTYDAEVEVVEAPVKSDNGVYAVTNH